MFLLNFEMNFKFTRVLSGPAANGMHSQFRHVVKNYW